MKKIFAILMMLTLLSVGGFSGCKKPDPQKPEDPKKDDIDTSDWESFELNGYATIKIDPAVAALQGDGTITAANDNWEASYEFASDEGLFSFIEAMLESAQADGAAVKEKQLGKYAYRVISTEEDDGTLLYQYIAKLGQPGLEGFVFMVNAKPETPLADFENLLSTLAIDEANIPDAPASFGGEPDGEKLEDDWAWVRFDKDAAALTYHTIEANDGSWSIEFGLPMTEYGLEVNKNDYNLITKGYGDQTDIVTGEKTLGDFAYRTIRYTQDGRSCAYYDCAFDAPMQVTAKEWDGSEKDVQLYGVFINCKANDGAALDELEDVIASLTILGS